VGFLLAIEIVDENPNDAMAVLGRQSLMHLAAAESRSDRYLTLGSHKLSRGGRDIDAADPVPGVSAVPIPI